MLVYQNKPAFCWLEKQSSKPVTLFITELKDKRPWSSKINGHGAERESQSNKNSTILPVRRNLFTTSYKSRKEFWGLSYSISLSPYLSLPISLYLPPSLYLPISLLRIPLYLSVFTPIWLPLSVSTYVYLPISLYLSLHLSLSTYISLPISLSHTYTYNQPANVRTLSISHTQTFFAHT